MSALQEFDQKLSNFIKFRPAPEAGDSYGAWFSMVYEITEKTAQSLGLAKIAPPPAMTPAPQNSGSMPVVPSAEVALPAYGKLPESEENIFEQNLRYFQIWPRCWNTNQAADLCDPARRVIECLQLGLPIDRLMTVLSASGTRFVKLLQDQYPEILKSYVTQGTLRQIIEAYLAAEARLQAPTQGAVVQSLLKNPSVSLSKEHLTISLPKEKPVLCEDPSELSEGNSTESDNKKISAQEVLENVSDSMEALSFPELYTLSTAKRSKLLIKTLATATTEDWGFKDGLSTSPELLMTAAQALKDFPMKDLAQYIRKPAQREELKSLLAVRKPEHGKFGFWQDLARTHAGNPPEKTSVSPVTPKPVTHYERSALVEVPKEQASSVLHSNAGGQYDIRFRFQSESLSGYIRALIADMELLDIKELNIAVLAFGDTDFTKIRAGFHNIQYRLDNGLIYCVKRTAGPDIIRISVKPESEKKVYRTRKRAPRKTVTEKSASVVSPKKPEVSMPIMREAIEEALLKGSSTMDVPGIPEAEVEEALRHLLDRIRYTGAIDHVCADGVLILEKRAVA